MDFPDKLKANLESLLGEDYAEFEALKDEKAYKGLRINTLKTDKSFADLGLIGEKSPFNENSYYVSEEQKYGASPLHHAGAFYMQEPSASSPITVMGAEKDDYVLDLCAAPGGKTTGIAQSLTGRGFILSNEINKKRANVLISNVERMGIHNAVVTNNSPKDLCDKLPCIFDKVLVDAPCSGEGMIRHDDSILKNWSYENICACKVRQLKILDSAVKPLKPGGVLVYSTCTFSSEENEDVVTEFLENHSDFYLESIDLPFGRSGYKGLKQVKRILWQDGGEGHFIAKFRKKADSEMSDEPTFIKGEESVLVNDFLNDNGISLPTGDIININGRFYLAPNVALPQGIGTLRAGLFLGEDKKGRFEPSHAMYMCPLVRTDKSLDLDDEAVRKFLHGEEISVDNSGKGYYRVMTGGVPCGFGKLSGGRLKNHYPKGLRTL